MEILKDNYTIIKCIGKGSFGTVYLTNDKSGNKFASKVEQKQESSRLQDEHKIYTILHKKGMKKGIPKIYSLIQTPSFNILIMELLGPSLDTIFTRYKKKFDLATVTLLGYDIVCLLEKLHKAGFIHRDIKPNNFLIGCDENSNKIYLTDFGLSRNYMKNGKHINFNSNKSLIGTLRYASINMHMGIEPSRRDDLESVGYMLIYFMKQSLPWQGLKTKSETEHIEQIGTVKMSINLNKLCEGLPKQFREYIKICKEIKFEEDPDYDKLKNCFISIATEHKLELKYQWTKPESKTILSEIEC
jgi:serine/threonine protein kinase